MRTSEELWNDEPMTMAMMAMCVSSCLNFSSMYGPVKYSISSPHSPGAWPCSAPKASPRVRQSTQRASPVHPSPATSPSTGSQSPSLPTSWVLSVIFSLADITSSNTLSTSTSITSTMHAHSRANSASEGYSSKSRTSRL
eukprot:319642-Prymnesium_polylepis.1